MIRNFETMEMETARNRRKELEAAKLKAEELKRGIKKAERKFCGATHLLEGIAKATGVEEDLKSCHPDIYKEILSLSRFIILEETATPSRFSHWHRYNDHPCKKDLSSQRLSELPAKITESSKMHFFKLQFKRRKGEEFRAFDTSSISTYSESLRQAKFGKNKDYDPLPQLNIALFIGEESNLPLYCRVFSGNLADVRIIPRF
jgi:hypothetical protein